jgi:hypothetical protein
MTSTVLSLLPELLELLFFGLSSIGLAAAGAYIEHFAYLTVQTGDSTLGVWASVIGVAAFYFAYLMATDKFGPKLTELRYAEAAPDRAE